MKKLISMSLIALIFIACGKNVSDNANPAPVSSTDPVAATLIFPNQNAVCTTGTSVSSTQSSITFTWNAATNATGYDMVLKNLLTAATTTQSTTATSLTVTLLKSTPYSWYIVSKSATVSATAQSAVWKFYNSGPGVTTYVPFPADLLSPSPYQAVAAGNISLTWIGSAPSGSSISNYDVYFGLSATPTLYKANVTDTFLNNLPIVTKTTYYWKILTRDLNGNTSYSQTGQFTVN